MAADADVLIIGGDGLIGSALVRKFAADGLRVIASSRRPGNGALPLDLAAPETWPRLPRVPVVIIAAAVARLADCEQRPAAAAAVNVVAPGLLAERFALQGTWCLYLSSDKVFDGTQPLRRRDAAPCPLTVYGRQKAAGEAMVRQAGGVVLRLSKVLDAALPLLTGWRDRLRRGEPITPFADMALAPVTLDSVVALIARLAADRRDGVFHLTGAADQSYAEMAVIVARALRAPAALIRPVPAPTETAGGILVPHSSLEMTRETALYQLGNPAFAAVCAEVAAALATGAA